MEDEKMNKGEYIFIRIKHSDASVRITDEHDNDIQPQQDPPPLRGPTRTYHQALWYSGSPTCVWFGGYLY